MSDHPIRMTKRALLALSEFSLTLPTGTTPGRCWRRAIPPFGDQREWWHGRYGKPHPAGHEHAGSTPIFWRRIIIQGRAAALSARGVGRDAAQDTETIRMMGEKP